MKQKEELNKEHHNKIQEQNSLNNDLEKKKKDIKTQIQIETNKLEEVSLENVTKEKKLKEKKGISHHISTKFRKRYSRMS